MEAGEADFIDKYEEWQVTSKCYHVLDEYGRKQTIHDTIGYIPIDTVRHAFERIYKLREEGRWKEVYQTLSDAMVFYPCTGAEYKERKAKGLL